MKLILVSLALLGLGSLSSCAAHNSHHVVVDLMNDFDPLINETYDQLLQR